MNGWPLFVSKIITRCRRLWDWLVDTCAETTADGNVTGGVAGLSSLIP